MEFKELLASRHNAPLSSFTANDRALDLYSFRGRADHDTSGDLLGEAFSEAHSSSSQSTQKTARELPYAAASPERPCPATTSRTKQPSALFTRPTPTRTSPRYDSIDQQYWQNETELKLHIEDVPQSWSTLEVYHAFSSKGHVDRIDLLPCARAGARSAKVTFRPRPSDWSWVREGIIVETQGGATVQLRCFNITGRPFIQFIKPDGRSYLNRITIEMEGLEFGVMHTSCKMLVFKTLNLASRPEVTLNLQQNLLVLAFQVSVMQKHSGTQAYISRQFKLLLSLTEMQKVHLLRDRGRTYLTASIHSPPQVFRRTTDIAATHDRQSTLWDDRHAWYRQTDIDLNPTGRTDAISIRTGGNIINVGRWLTYRLIFGGAAQSSKFQDICQALADHNIRFATQEPLAVARVDYSAMWNWLPESERSDALLESSDSWLHEMSHPSTRLDFPVRYQLEACISQGLIHECNISCRFIETLSTVNAGRASKILAKVLDQQRRYYNPDDIIGLPVSIAEKKRPSYCTKILSATVTPTTIYFHTPVLETSNRVVRHFQEHEDRFLRVKFLDERYKGSLRSQDGRAMDEVYSRVKRTMKYGIQIGARKYEFLAFGNSQFREHGAYFFAADEKSTNPLTSDTIRAWMGDFDHIRVVAKYASRLGQCFSTTRAVPGLPPITNIPDIERNGFCFTDGVGKISSILAHTISSHLGLPTCLSMIQFRLGGCKGVLAVDPTIKGLEIHMRPSQQKFPNKRLGLEICRISHFIAANLNVQIILVLSALGIPDRVFVKKLHSMLHDFEEAMTKPAKAFQMLSTNVDYNRSTIVLASMIEDRFMETREPFMISCLRLWRSWTLKYLKEKAKIFVEDGAFVLGCADETETLRGYSNNTPHYDLREEAQSLLELEHQILKADSCSDASLDNSETDKLAEAAYLEHFQARQAEIDESLPQIFIQVPVGLDRKYRVITGRCLITRNPALHPGDARVVLAVDVPALRHLKDCVVFPQHGDRDLANMCSGGDLDGDDFMVIWDKDLLPPELNHEAMDYTAPAPLLSETGTVTVDEMTSFFVKHIKNDNLARIAVAHRYWADLLPAGVKDPKCIALAHLHSKAVDYAKTGVPADFPKDLRVSRWPHWSQVKGKARDKVYHSKKVIGQLYDAVTLEDFQAAWDMPFDTRILEAAAPNVEMIQRAAEVKCLYDESLTRIMSQYGIQSEFEVIMTFPLARNQEHGDYKLAEVLGELVTNLRQQFKMICYDKAGTTPEIRDPELMKPFIVAMYTVTATQVTEALERSKQTTTVSGKVVPLQERTFVAMPLMSFPWIFQRELGEIATGGARQKFTKTEVPVQPMSRNSAMPKSRPGNASNMSLPEGLTEVVIPDTVESSVLIGVGSIPPTDLVNDGQLDETSACMGPEPRGWPGELNSHSQRDAATAVAETLEQSGKAKVSGVEFPSSRTDHAEDDLGALLEKPYLPPTAYSPTIGIDAIESTGNGHHHQRVLHALPEGSTNIVNSDQKDDDDVTDIVPDDAKVITDDEMSQGEGDKWNSGGEEVESGPDAEPTMLERLQLLGY